MKHLFRYAAIALLAVVFCYSGAKLLGYYTRDHRESQALEQLDDLRHQAQTAPTTAEVPTSDPVMSEPEPTLLPALAALYGENPDLFGWIEIPETSLSYPVMFTPQEPEYYLRRGFDGAYSYSGLPFLDGACQAGGSHYLIHGHNIKAGSMFALLLDYARQSHFLAHPVIRFDTLYEAGEYEVLAAFYTEILPEGQPGFRYYRYIDLSDPAVFQEYLDQVAAAALYDTGITAQYGDTILTLSTCSYHAEEGRFVVVARKSAAD